MSHTATRSGRTSYKATRMVDSSSTNRYRSKSVDPNKYKSPCVKSYGDPAYNVTGSYLNNKSHGDRSRSLTYHHGATAASQGKSSTVKKRYRVTGHLTPSPDRCHTISKSSSKKSGAVTKKFNVGFSVPSASRTTRYAPNYSTTFLSADVRRNRERTYSDSGLEVSGLAVSRYGGCVDSPYRYGSYSPSGRSYDDGALRPILRQSRSTDRLTREYNMKRSRSLNDISRTIGRYGSSRGQYGSDPYGSGNGPYGNGGDPYGIMSGPYGRGGNPNGGGSGPYGRGGNPNGGGSGPYGRGGNPNGGGSGPYGRGGDPNGGGSGPYGRGGDPNGSGSGPYGRGGNPNGGGNGPYGRGGDPNGGGSGPYGRGGYPNGGNGPYGRGGRNGRPNGNGPNGNGPNGCDPNGNGPNGNGPNGNGPNGNGPNGNGPNGNGPNGNGPNGNGPNGNGPNGNGPNGNGPNGNGPNGNGPNGNGPYGPNGNGPNGNGPNGNGPNGNGPYGPNGNGPNGNGPYGNGPNGNGPYGPNGNGPNGNGPNGNGPNGNGPNGNGPNGNGPNGNGPNGKGPNGNDPNGNGPYGPDGCRPNGRGRYPFGRDPFGRGPFGRDPTGRDPFGRDPTGRDPFGRDPTGRDPFGRDPTGRDPFGRDPFGRDPFGRDPFGRDPTGRDPSGRDPSGRDPSGRDPSGRDPFGRDPFGRDPAGPNGQNGLFGPNGEIIDGNFPVCSRFPNCSVCIIDIPQNQVSRDEVLVNMQTELKEDIENIVLIEKKDKEIHLKAESISHITQLLQKTKKELEIKIIECNRRDTEVKRLKQELKNCVNDKKKIEHSSSSQQITITKLESVEIKLQQLTVKYDEVVVHNRELMERIKILEVSEKEFIDLERNVIDLQVQLRDMEDIELHRDELFQKLQFVKTQRDEFLEKGKIVEEERNEFVRSNTTLEQYLADWKRKTVEFKKTNQALKDRIIILEKDKKVLEERIVLIQEERVVIQTTLKKVEVERDDHLRELKEVTIDRNNLETKLNDLEDMLNDYDQLEEGFHSLRLKVAELTRQRDDAELLIPSYKGKLHLLKKTIHEKEDTIMQITHELKTLKIAIESSTFEDVSKLKSLTFLTSDSSIMSRRPLPSTKPGLINYFNDGNITPDGSPNGGLPHGGLPHGGLPHGGLPHGGLPHGGLPHGGYPHGHPNNKLRPNDFDLTTDSDSYDQVLIRQQYDSTDESVTHRHPNLPRRGRRFVALFDYDPFRSSTSDHPERELPLKEGDYVTVFGDIDMDGFYDAELDGNRGLVPGMYVEDMSSLADDGSVPSYKKDPNYPSDSDDSPVRKYVVLFDYDPFTMGTTDRPDSQLPLRKGEIVIVYGSIDADGYYDAVRNGKRGLIPSNFVQECSSSTTMSTTTSTSNALQYHQHALESLGEGESTTTYHGTIEVVEESSGGGSSSGPPYAPRDLKVVRVVTQNAVLLGWGLPSMDEFGRSNGCLVTGYRILVNGKCKQDCDSPSMTKALIDEIDLQGRVEFSIQTIGENGFCSEKCHFAITGALSALSKDNEFEAGSENNYVALYDYDPFKSSPNPNPALELSFHEGDFVRVYDTSRTDGFYGAEINGQRGLVPSNFIERITISTNYSLKSSHHETDCSRRVQFQKD